MRSDMNGLASYEAIVASGAMEVVSTVQIRIFRGFRDQLGQVSINLKDRDAAWRTTKFGAFRAIEMLTIGDVVESCGQEIPTVTVDVSDFQFELAPGRTESFKECAIRGILDGASLRVNRWVSTAGWTEEEFDLYDFGGYIEQAQPTEFGVSLSCKAWIGKLAAASYPRHLVSPWCRHELGDANCGVASEEIDVGVRAGSTRSRVILWGSLGQFDDYRNGTMRMTYGRSTGFVRTIERIEDLGEVEGGHEWAFHIAPPGFPLPVVTGDTAGIRKACDKTLAMCRSRFNNELRHGGFPFVPPPESV